MLTSQSLIPLAETFHEVDFQGPARKAARERFWRKQVLDQARSELTARAFCRAHGLPQSSFYGWPRELAQWDRQAKVKPSTSVPSSPPPRFAEVVLTGAPVATSVCSFGWGGQRWNRSSIRIAIAYLGKTSIMFRLSPLK